MWHFLEQMVYCYLADASGKFRTLQHLFFFHLLHRRYYFPVKIRNWNPRQETKLVKMKKKNHTGALFTLTSSCSPSGAKSHPGVQKELADQPLPVVSEDRHQKL